MSFTYFIADLHLSADRPDITECLMRFLKEDAINADALYVLGDLFEVWIGDDNITPFNTAIAAAFKEVRQHCPIYFIHGNRDFAIREKWLSKAGMTLLNEQELSTCTVRLLCSLTVMSYVLVMLLIKNFARNLAVGGGLV